MTAYTNRRSLELTYGVAEVDGLIPEDAALEKAALAAQEEIDSYLHTAGYALPLIFTQWVGDAPSNLPPMILRHSDSLTAWNLASAEDMHKQKYDLDRAEAQKWLEKVASGEIRVGNLDGSLLVMRSLDVNGVYPNGGSLATTFSRPRIFNASMQPLPYPGTKVQL
jgi:phage gp36-like protein